MEAWTTPQNILSFVLVLVTLAYTITSILTWLESRATRMQKNEPNIIVYLRSNVSHDTLYVCVKNIGEGCARNVKVIPIKDYSLFGKDLKLGNFSLFSEGVNVFPPQFEMIFPLDSWSNVNLEKDPYVQFTVFYTDLQDLVKQNNFKLPFRQLKTLYSTPPPMAEERIPYYLNQIHKDIKQIKDSCK